MPHVRLAPRNSYQLLDVENPAQSLLRAEFKNSGNLRARKNRQHPSAGGSSLALKKLTSVSDEDSASTRESASGLRRHSRTSSRDRTSRQPRAFRLSS